MPYPCVCKQKHFGVPIAVTFGSAFRALNYGKEMEKNRDMSEASIILDRSQALMIPIMSYCSLLMMFYLFSSVSQLLTAFTAIASISSLYFVFSPYIAYFKSQYSLSPICVSLLLQIFYSNTSTFIGSMHQYCRSMASFWKLDIKQFLGISLCVAFVSHVRLPNIKVCAMLLIYLFVYDIFWVFYSEMFFGSNVMVAVATQQANNLVYTVANSLSLPGLQLITKKLEFPVKIIFPRNLFGSILPGNAASDFMMLGLGDMAIPSMLLALVLCFDNRKDKELDKDNQLV